METTMQQSELARKTMRLKQDIKEIFEGDLLLDEKSSISVNIGVSEKELIKAQININFELRSLHCDRLRVLTGKHNFNDYRIKRSGDGLRILLTK